MTQRWRGLLIFLLGMATVLGSLFFLETCADAGHYATLANGMKVHMGCTWTERAVLGLGGLVTAIGAIMAAAPLAARALSTTAASSGLLLLVTPLWLIPTCPNPMMACNLSLKPGALLLGGLVTLGGLAGAVGLRRTEGGEGLPRAERSDLLPRAERAR